jgi:predicted enzyme related to lactoylglutathione lyase
VRMPGFPSGANSVLVYFSCADCAVEAARAAQCGGKIEKAKFSIGQYGHIALVFDTEGNMIGLHSMQ